MNMFPNLSNSIEDQTTHSHGFLSGEHKDMKFSANRKIAAFFFSIAFLAFPLSLNAASVTLYWNASPESDLAAYKVYKRIPPSTSYGSPVYEGLTSTPSNPTQGISGLNEGTTYGFIVTATDTSGNESSPSNEILLTPSGGGGGGTPTVTSPTPGSTLPGASTTFSWTPNSTSVSEWWLYVGTSQGDKNLHDSGSLGSGTLSRSVSGLPTNGSPVWVRLFWRTSGSWQSADFQYTTGAGSGGGGSTPTLTSPTPGSTLPGATTTFTWTPNSTSVSEWWLYVGTSQGDKNLHDSGSLGSGTLSRSVSGLPTNGSPVWVRLFWRTSGSWQSADFQYTTGAGSGGGGSTPTLTSPTPGSTLPGASTTFTWTPNSTSVSEWWLYVGTAQGAKNLHDSGSLASGTLSRSVSGLPTNSSTVWVQLWWKTGGNWQSANYQYTAAGGGGGGGGSTPTITSPAPGSTLPGASTTFSWTPNSTSVSEWWLYVGTTQGAKNLHDSGSLASGTLSRSVSGLPTNSSTVWVQLWWKTGGSWQSANHQYTAAGGGGGGSTPTITSPAPGSTLAGGVHHVFLDPE